MLSPEGSELEDSREDLPPHLVALFFLSLTGAVFFVRTICNAMSPGAACEKGQTSAVSQPTGKASLNNAGEQSLRRIRYGRYFKSKTATRKANDGRVRLKTPLEFKEQLKVLFAKRKAGKLVESDQPSLTYKTNSLDHFLLQPHVKTVSEERMQLLNSTNNSLENFVDKQLSPMLHSRVEKESDQPSLTTYKTNSLDHFLLQPHVKTASEQRMQLLMNSINNSLENFVDKQIFPMEHSRVENRRSVNTTDLEVSTAESDICLANRRVAEIGITQGQAKETSIREERKNCVTTLFAKSCFSSKISLSPFDPKLMSESGDANLCDSESIVIYDPLDVKSESFESIGFRARDFSYIPAWDCGEDNIE